MTGVAHNQVGGEIYTKRCVLIILNYSHLTTDVLVNKMYLREPFGVYNPQKIKVSSLLSYLEICCLPWPASAYFSLYSPNGFAL